MSTTLKPKWPRRRMRNGRSSRTPPTSYNAVEVWVAMPPMLPPVPDGHQEHRAVVGREKAADLVVEEGQPGRAQAKRVGGQVHPPALNARRELRRPIATIAEAPEDLVQIGQPVDAGRGVCRQLLAERQEARYLTPLVRVHEQVRRGESDQVANVGLDRLPGEVHDARQLLRRDWRVREPPR